MYFVVSPTENWYPRTVLNDNISRIFKRQHRQHRQREEQGLVVWIEKNQDKPLAVDANVSYEPLMA